MCWCRVWQRPARRNAQCVGRASSLRVCAAPISASSWQRPARRNAQRVGPASSPRVCAAPISVSSCQRPARRNAQRVGRASSLGVGAARLARVASLYDRVRVRLASYFIHDEPHLIANDRRNLRCAWAPLRSRKRPENHLWTRARGRGSYVRHRGSLPTGTDRGRKPSMRSVGGYNVERRATRSTRAKRARSLAPSRVGAY